MTWHHYALARERRCQRYTADVIEISRSDHCLLFSSLNAVVSFSKLRIGSICWNNTHQLHLLNSTYKAFIYFVCLFFLKSLRRVVWRWSWQSSTLQALETKSIMTTGGFSELLLCNFNLLNIIITAFLFLFTSQNATMHLVPPKLY